MRLTTRGSAAALAVGATVLLGAGGPVPVSSAGGTSTAPAAHAVQVVSSRTVTLPYGGANRLAVDGPTAYVTAEDRTGRLDRVVAVDLPSRKTTLVARSAFDTGVVDQLAAAAGWVAWSDESHQEGGSTADLEWRVWAADVATGEQVELASGTSTEAAYSTVAVHGTGGRFVIERFEDGVTTELLWRPGDEAPQVNRSGLAFLPLDVSIVGDRVVYLGDGAATSPNDAGDCWATTIGSDAAPVALTRTGLAAQCGASDDGLVWTDHIAPDHHPLPPEGVLSNPWVVRAKALSPAAKARVVDGGRYLAEVRPVIGDGFLAWQVMETATPVRVGGSRFATSAVTIRTPEDIGAVVASGRRLVVVSHPASRTRSSLVVVRLGSR